MATANGGPIGVNGADGARALEGAALEALALRMKQAVELRQAGKDGDASRLLKDILKEEPRLAEPRLELAHISAMEEDWGEAQAQARLAVRTLRAGGQWTMDVEAGVLLAFALNLLGEVLVRPLEAGDLFLVDRARFEKVWNEAAAFFEEAKQLDPANEDARRNRARYRPIEPGN